MAIRAKNGKSQAEFAGLAGVSERTLRTWEATGDVSTESGRRILARLQALGVYPAAPRRAVKYRDRMTGATWSGRGQMPIWLRLRIHAGARLDDFASAS